MDIIRSTTRCRARGVTRSQYLAQFRPAWDALPRTLADAAVEIQRRARALLRDGGVSEADLEARAVRGMEIRKEWARAGVIRSANPFLAALD